MGVWPLGKEQSVWKNNIFLIHLMKPSALHTRWSCLHRQPFSLEASQFLLIRHFFSGLGVCRSFYCLTSNQPVCETCKWSIRSEQILLNHSAVWSHFGTLFVLLARHRHSTKSESRFNLVQEVLPLFLSCIIQEVLPRSPWVSSTEQLFLLSDSSGTTLGWPFLLQ